MTAFTDRRGRQHLVETFLPETPRGHSIQIGDFSELKLLEGEYINIPYPTGLRGRVSNDLSRSDMVRVVAEPDLDYPSTRDIVLSERSFSKGLIIFTEK